MGNFIAWDAGRGQDRVVQAGEVLGLVGRARQRPATSSFYGTLEGYLKAVSTKDGKELWKFKTPSGNHRQRVHV